MKTFQEHETLVSILSHRGLAMGDVEVAAQHLRRHGYHRLGGYRYPFREMLPLHERDEEARTFRRDTYMPGARFDDVLALAEFDAGLRTVVLKGALDFEVRLREAVAHVIARRHPHGHLLQDHLDLNECAQPTNEPGITKFEAWRATAAKAVGTARNEDYVVHHFAVGLGTDLPIWALLDLLNFGSIPYLLDLLKQEDATEVAGQFGVGHAARFPKWVRAIVDLRNDCAHNVRLFNRTFKRAIKVRSNASAGPRLRHMYELDAAAQKFYPVNAVLAHMLRSHEASTNWHMSLKTQVRKLPKVTLDGFEAPLFSPQVMGFPDDWESLDLWN